MGVYWTASAIFGYKLNVKEIFPPTVTMNRACDHPIQNDAKFCPTCGVSTKMVKEEIQSAEYYDFNEFVFENLPDELAFTFSADDHDIIYIGIGLSGVDRDKTEKSMDIKSEEEMKKIISEKLSAFPQLKLHDRKFRLWCVMSGS